MSADSSTQVNIPDALTSGVHEHKQYGMQFPDGSVRWNTVETNRGTLYVDRIASGDGTSRATWAEYLARVARDVKLNPYDYSNGHKIIVRTVILSVTEAADHSNLRPWDAPEPPAPWEVVKPPKF